MAAVENTRDNFWSAAADDKAAEPSWSRPAFEIIEAGSEISLYVYQR
jgi:hypothetical protein